MVVGYSEADASEDMVTETFRWSGEGDEEGVEGKGRGERDGLARLVIVGRSGRQGEEGGTRRASTFQLARGVVPVWDRRASVSFDNHQADSRTGSTMIRQGCSEEEIQQSRTRKTRLH